MQTQKQIRQYLSKELPNISEFFLHGSRDRGVSNENSDWDFACQHFQPWENQRTMMEKAGWSEIIIESYVDNDTAFVYEKVVEGVKIQISFRQDLTRYKHCWNAVSWDFYKKYLWKQSPFCLPVEDRRDFWNSLYYSYDRGVF